MILPEKQGKFSLLLIHFVLLQCLMATGQTPLHRICVDELEILFFSTRMNFDPAKGVCANYGGDLVKIGSVEMQNAIGRVVASTSAEYYIGAYDVNSDNLYIWLSDGTNVPSSFSSGYQNWRNGQPNSVNEHCVALGVHGSYQWTDVFCNGNRRFICQRAHGAIFTTPLIGDFATCIATASGVSVQWKRNSEIIPENTARQIYQTIESNKATLHLEKLNITDDGVTYTCESNSCSASKDIQVTLDGNPVITEVENNQCNASLIVRWKPATAGLGFIHRIRARNVTNTTMYVIPSNDSNQTTELIDLAHSTHYTVEIQVCLSRENCVAKYFAESQNITDGMTDPVETARLEINGTNNCIASWEPSPEAYSYTVNTSCTIEKSRNTKNPVSETTFTRMNETTFKPPPNRRCEAFIEAKGCGEISKPVKANGVCITSPKGPESVSPPTLINLGSKSQSLQVVRPNEDNGLISCVFIILCYGKCSNIEFTMEDLRMAHMENSSNERNSIALSIPLTRFLENHLSFELSGGKVTHCNVYDDGITKSTDFNNGTFYGINKVADTDMHVGVFVVTTSPVDKTILLKTSPMITLLNNTNENDGGTKEESTGNNLWVIGLVFGLLGVITGVVSGVMIARRNQPATQSNDERPTSVQTVSASRLQTALDAQESAYGYENDVESPIYEKMKESGTGPGNGEPSSYENI